EAGGFTTTTYDSTYQKFSAQENGGNIINTTFNYDARSGELSSSTDPRGMITRKVFDPFLILMENDSSSPTNATVLIVKHDYGLGMSNGFSTNFVHLRKADDVDPTNGHETWTYFDGLGRQIQVREEAEVNGYRVNDAIYDKRGAVKFQAQLYFSPGTLFTKP